MNLILLKSDQVAHGRARLGAARARHIRHVLGKGVGDRVRIGVVGLGVGHARLLALDDAGASLEVPDPATLDPAPAPAPHALALALPRPPMLRRVLQAAASMGVKDIHVFHAARVERSFWHSHALDPEQVHAQLVLGLEQARDCVLPRVTWSRGFRAFVDEGLPRLAGGDPILVADGAGAPCPADLVRRHVIVVGPEGGLVPHEIERLQAAGAHAVSLGPRALRVEHAVPAVLARLCPIPAVRAGVHGAGAP